jgi:hypothetical protein
MAQETNVLQVMPTVNIYMPVAIHTRLRRTTAKAQQQPDLVNLLLIL